MLLPHGWALHVKTMSAVVSMSCSNVGLPIFRGEGGLATFGIYSREGLGRGEVFTFGLLQSTCM